jgi:hypothetical protein
MNPNSLGYRAEQTKQRSEIDSGIKDRAEWKIHGLCYTSENTTRGISSNDVVGRVVQELPGVRLFIIDERVKALSEMNLRFLLQCIVELDPRPTTDESRNLIEDARNKKVNAAVEKLVEEADEAGLEVWLSFMKRKG